MVTSPAQAALHALAAGGRHNRDQRPARSPAVNGDATEVVFLDRNGWEALGLVSGAAVFHVGIVGWPSGNIEIAQLSNAMYEARERALAGLRDEAIRLGADGVVGASVDVHFMEDHRHLPRFVATGSAVRRTRPDGSDDGGAGLPFVTTMTASHVGLLRAAGYEPIGLVMGSCVYHVGRRRLWEWVRYLRRNDELAGYTTAFYAARELAMTRLQDEARQLSAAGVVGVTSAQRSHVWGSRVIEFFALGNAVAPVEGEVGLVPPFLTLSLNDVTSRIDPASIVEERADTGAKGFSRSHPDKPREGFSP